MFEIQKVKFLHYIMTKQLSLNKEKITIKKCTYMYATDHAIELSKWNYSLKLRRKKIIYNTEIKEGIMYKSEQCTSFSM